MAYPNRQTVAANRYLDWIGDGGTGVWSSSLRQLLLGLVSPTDASHSTDTRTSYTYIHAGDIESPDYRSRHQPPLFSQDNNNCRRLAVERNKNHPSRISTFNQISTAQRILSLLLAATGSPKTSDGGKTTESIV